MRPLASATSSLRTTSTASTRPSPRIATGETQNRSTTRLRLPRRRRRGRLAQHLDVAPRERRVVLERRGTRRVELEIGRVDDEVGARELRQLDQLGRRERRLRRAAAPEDDDLLGSPSRAIAAIASSVVSVGASSSAVSASIRATSTATFPLPITTARSDGEIEREVLEVGMAVVPGDERRRGPRAGQVLAGNPHPPVGLRAEGIDDGVVERRQLVVREVAADLDVAEEPKARALRDLLEGARDGLDLRVVGGDAEPDEPPRRRQPVEHVDLDGRLVAREQRAGRVEPRRARADDGDAKRHARSAHGATRIMTGGCGHDGSDNGREHRRGTSASLAVAAAIVGGGARAVALAWLGWAWYESRLPATYSVMDYAIPDDGGAPIGVPRMRHAHGGTSVADLDGPRGDAAAALHADRARRDGPARVGTRSCTRLSFNGTVPGPGAPRARGRPRRGDAPQPERRRAASRSTGTASTCRTARTASPA